MSKKARCILLGLMAMFCIALVCSVCLSLYNFNPTNDTEAPTQKQPVNTLSITNDFSDNQYIVINGKVYQYNSQPVNSSSLTTFSNGITFNSSNTLELIFIKENISTYASTDYKNNIASIFQATKTENAIKITIIDEYSKVTVENSLDAVYTLGNMAVSANANLTYNNEYFNVENSNSSTSFVATTTHQQAQVLNISSGNFILSGQKTYTAKTEGRAIYQTGGTLSLTQDICLSAFNYNGSGGAVYMSGGTLNANGTIRGCKANNGGGGAIYCSAGTINISKGVIGDISASSVATATKYSNFASSGGGGIYLTGGAILNVSDSATFSYNTGTAGGAIYSASDSDVINITKGSFKYNYSRTGSGGAIYSYATVTMSDGTFVENVANTYGGAIMIKNTKNNVISGGNITNNSTENNEGGGIRCDGKLTISGTTSITNNSAKTYGGGVSGYGTIILTGGTISNNTSGSYGGGIYTHNSFTLTGGTVSNNTATTAGPQIALAANSYITITSSLSSSYIVYKNGLTTYDDNSGNASAIAYSTNSTYLNTAKSKITVSNLSSAQQLVTTRRTNFLVCEWNTHYLAINPNTADDTYSNSTTYGAYIKNAVTYDGNDYKVVSRSYMYADKITVNVWAYMDNWSTYGANGMRIYSCTEGGGWNLESASGKVQFASYDSGVGYKVAATSTTWASLSSGWHMFTMTFDGTYARGYIDATLVGTSSAYSSKKIGYHASNVIFIGAEAGASATAPAGSYFSGKIQGFQIVNDCYYQAELADIYSAGRGFLYISKNIDETYTLNNPSKSGHTFKQWTLFGSGTLTAGTGLSTYTFANGNGTATAEYTINKYTLTVNTGTSNLFDQSDLAESKTVTGNNASYTYDAKSMQYTYTSTGNDPYVTFNATAYLTANTTYYFHFTALNQDGSLPTGTRWGIFWVLESAGFTGTQYFNLTYGDCLGSFTPTTTGNYKFRVDEQNNTTGTWILSNFWIGTSANYSTYQLEYNSTKTLDVPQWIGHTFKGWKHLGSGSISGNTVTMGAGNANVSAMWETNTYTVTYDANGGTVTPTSVAINYNQLYGTLPTPTRAGYSFFGWNGKNVLNLSTSLVAPAYTTLVDSSTMSFNVTTTVGGVANTISGFKVQQYLNGSYVYQIFATGVLGHHAYTFTKTSAFNQLRIAVNGSKADSTYVVDASHLTDGQEYTFSFNIDAFDGQACTATVSKLMIEAGNTYTGFQPYYVTATTPANIAADHTLTAHWVANIYKVTLDNQGATTAGTTEVYYQFNTSKNVGGLVNSFYYDLALTQPVPSSLISKPTKTGHTFGGYYSATNGGGTRYISNYGVVATALLQVANDSTLYAKWFVDKYNVTFDPNGGYRVSDSNSNPVTISYDYGHVEGISERARTGYTLTGYTVTDTDGGSNIGGATTTFDSATKTGSVTVGAADIIVKMVWTPNIYKVTLDNQGATTAGTTEFYYKYNTFSMAFLSTEAFYSDSACTSVLMFSLISVPQKVGYTFGGYYTSTGGSGTQYISSDGTINVNLVYVANNSTLYAKWTVNTYKVQFNVQGGTITGTLPTTVTYDTSFTVNNPSYPGYSFSGWQITGMDNSQHFWGASASSYTGNNNPSAVNVIAQWFKNLTSVNNATVTFKAIYNYAGLYEHSTSRLLYTWQQLISNNLITLSTNNDAIYEASTSLAGDLYIPAHIKRIVSFQGCTKLTSVVIPNSVENISASAFSGCTGLQYITMGSGVEEIGYEAFEGCTALKYFNITDLSAWCKVELNDFTCNPLVASSNGAIYLNGKPLVDLTIPGSVGSVGDYTFYKATNIKNVTISNGITTIGSSAFRNCTSITNVTIPNSVTTIGSYAFASSSALTKLTLGSGLTTIGTAAFLSCSNLTHLYIPSILDWCEISFSNSNTANPINLADYFYVNNTIVNDIVIPNTITTIPAYAFYNADFLRTITIPSSVTSIGTYAFYDADSLASVDIPNSVTSIGNYAFRGCSALKVAYIGSGVTSIGNYSFYDCDALTIVQMSVGGNVPTLGGAYVFGSVSSSSTFNASLGIYVPYSKYSTYTSATNWSTWKNYIKCAGLYGTDGTFTPWSTLVSNGSSGGVVVSGTTITDCDSNLAGYLVISEDITTIGTDAFEYCRQLTNVFMPSSITTIGENAFYGCYKLTEANIGNGVTTIKAYAFGFCSAITSVTIPASLKTVGTQAFTNCTNITTVNILDLESYCKIDFANSTPIYYAKTFAVGGQIISKLVIPNTVTEIKPYSFYRSNNITELVLPEGLLSIGKMAFSYCGSLTSVVIPNSVTTIGEKAFNYCTALEYLHIGSGVSSISSAAFGETSLNYIDIGSLSSWCQIDFLSVNANPFFASGNDCEMHLNNVLQTNIIIPSTITAIKPFTFAHCTSLVSVTLPSSVNTIGYEAFNDCINLVNITALGNISSITGSYVFSGCDNLQELNFMANTSVPTIEDGTNAFAYSSTTLKINVPTGLLSSWKAATNWSNYSSKIVSESSAGLFNSAGTLMYSWGNLINSGHITISGSTITDFNTSLAGKLIISPTITAIGANAFQSCSKLTDVRIPGTVTSIGAYAFDGCSGLTTITIPASVTTVGNYAFRNCTNATLATIYNTVIGSYQFYGCTSLALYSCSSVTTIGGYAFYGCTALTTAYLPKTVTSVVTHAFYNCSQLTKVLIDDIPSFCNITFSNVYANPLYYAKSLYINGATSSGPITEVVIPEGVSTIKSYAFYNNTSITSITLPSTLTNVGSMAFYGCSSLITANVPSIEAWLNITWGGSYASYLAYYLTTLNVNGSALTNLIIPESITTIKNYAFGGAKFLTRVTIHNKVTSIGSNAFSSCSNLVAVYITDLTAWCNMTFANTQSNPLNSAKKLYLNNSLVTNLVIPSNVSSISKYAFYQCTSITSVVIPPTLTTIGTDAFNGCTSVTKFYVPNIAILCNMNVGNICATPFYSGNSVCLYVSSTSSTSSIVVPSFVTGIRANTFSYLRTIHSVTLPESIIGVNEYAFYNCASLSTVTFQNSPAFIGERAFSYCSDLTTVNLGYAITNIGNHAFSYSTSLQSIVIPDWLTDIGNYAFYNCTGLISITLGASVETIGDYAFHSCTNATYYNFTRLAQVPIAGSNVLGGINAGASIYVISDLYSDFINDSAWSYYADYMVSSANAVNLNADLYTGQPNTSNQNNVVTFTNQTISNNTMVSVDNITTTVWLDDKFRKLQENNQTEVDFKGITLGV